MNSWRKILLQLSVVVVVSLLVLTPVVSAAPPAQDPRPPGGGNGGDGGGTGGGSNGDGSSDALPPNPTCASLKGQVINWGAGGIGGVQMVLDAGSWRLSAASASDGNYGYGGLGVGVARLQTTLPEALAAQLQPHIRQAGVYLNCTYPLVANMAVSGGGAVEPPASLTMSAPDTLTPGESTVIRLVIKNTLPNPISNVTVTDLFPQGLTPVEINTNTGTARIVDGAELGRLAFIYFNAIPSGADENILITVAVAEDLPAGAQIQNAATLFYTESVADQAVMDFVVGGLLAPAALPATEIPSPADEFSVEATAEPSTAAAGETLPAATPETDEGENFVPPPNMPTTGDDFSPPPALLPETGQMSATGLGVFFTLSIGVIVGGFAYGLYSVRRRRD